MRMAGLIAGGLAFLLPAPSMSTSPAGGRYLLSMQLRDGDRVLGSPRLRIAAGSPARIELGDEPGNRYSVAITATPRANDAVLIASTIDIVSGGAHRTMAPSLLVRLGEPAAIAIGDAAAPFRVDLTLVPAS